MSAEIPLVVLNLQSFNSKQGICIIAVENLRRTQFSLMALLIGVALLASVLGISRYALQRLTPKTQIEGRVVYDRDGRPAAFVVVHAQRVSNEEPYAWGRVLTDRQGCYRLSVVPEGTYNIWAEHDGYIVKALKSLRWNDDTDVPDLRLIRGGTISGRVIDAETGKPVKIPPSVRGGIGLQGPSRPQSGSAISLAPVMSDGTFFIRAAPGKNYVYVPWVRSDLTLPTAVWVEVKDGSTVEVELKVPGEKRGD